MKFAFTLLVLLAGSRAEASCAAGPDMYHRTVKARITGHDKVDGGCVVALDVEHPDWLTQPKVPVAFTQQPELCSGKAKETGLVLAKLCCDGGEPACGAAWTIGDQSGTGVQYRAFIPAKEAIEKHTSALKDFASLDRTEAAQKEAGALVELSEAQGLAAKTIGDVTKAMRAATAAKKSPGLTPYERIYVRSAAALAVARIAPSQATKFPQIYAWSVGSVLLGQLDFDALHALADHKQDAAKLAPSLMELIQLKGDGPETRYACEALALLGPGAKMAVPTILKTWHGKAGALDDSIADCGRALCALDPATADLGPMEKRVYRCDPLDTSVPFVPAELKRSEIPDLMAEATTYKKKGEIRRAYGLATSFHPTDENDQKRQQALITGLRAEVGK